MTLNNRRIHSNNRKESFEDMAETRIITKNLVYVIGLSSSVADREKLHKFEYFGQYGSIIKIVVNKNKAYNQNNPNGPSFSAYVTFSKPSEASIAILSLDETLFDNHLIRASFGTTKYCSFFLKGVECNNRECLFLHKLADENDIIKRGDLIANKNIFAQQHSYAIKIADIYNPEIKKKILASKNNKVIFPPPYTIYDSPIVIENDPTNIKSFNNSNNMSKKTSFSKKENTYKNLTRSPSSKEKINKSNFLAKDNNFNINLDINKSISEKLFVNNNNSFNNNCNNNTVEKTKKGEKNKSNENLKKIERKNKNNLFFNREESRFDFGKNNTNEEGPSINVPVHILNLINKKIVLHGLTKYMHQKAIDGILEKESIKDDEEAKIDDWTQFIKDNTESPNNSQVVIDNNSKFNYNDEYINDIENINKFILNKVASMNNEK